MNEVEAYIRKAAQLRGMDPDGVVKAIMTEGGTSDPFRQSRVKKNGVYEPSYGPMQLLIGGEGTGFPRGLGNVALEMGIDPRTNWQGGIDVGLDTVINDGDWGQWYGVADNGLSPTIGLTPNSRALGKRGITLNSNPIASGGYASEGPMQEAHNRVVKPLTGPTNVADRPIADVKPAGTGLAGDLKGLLDKVGDFANTEKGGKAFETLAGAFGGGSSSGSSGAPEIAPSNLGASIASEQAARASSAQMLMSQILQKRRKAGGVPGLSLMG